MLDLKVVLVSLEVLVRGRVVIVVLKEVGLVITYLLILDDWLEMGHHVMGLNIFIFLGRFVKVLTVRQRNFHIETFALIVVRVLRGVCDHFLVGGSFD